MVNSSLTLQKLQIYDWVTCCFNKFCIVGMELVQALQRKDLTFFVTFNYHRFDQNYFFACSIRRWSCISATRFTMQIIPRLNHIQTIVKCGQNRTSSCDDELKGMVLFLSLEYDIPVPMVLTSQSWTGPYGLTRLIINPSSFKKKKKKKFKS